MNEASPLLRDSEDGGSLLPGEAKLSTKAINNSKASGRFPTLAALLKEGAVVNNVGSTARDHLANERTYLAWMRTGLAMIGVSLGLLKWDANGNASEGYLVAFLGVVVLLMATNQYFRNMQLLAGGLFEPNVHGIVMVVVVVVAAIGTAFALQFYSYREHQPSN